MSDIPTVEEMQEVVEGIIKQLNAAEDIISAIVDTPELAANPRVVTALFSYLTAKLEANAISRRLKDKYPGNGEE